MRPADLDTPLMWISDQRVMTLHSPGVPSAGCARKGCTTHTSDWREPRGSEGNRGRQDVAHRCSRLGLRRVP